ncbi:MAG: putative DedA/PAP2 family phospholipid acid phosphatase [Acidimicrobiales bacterium]|nr:putative DedA/PAP2 family phospholipid acid phosphatase [Acidimicrobiales bacterium]
MGRLVERLARHFGRGPALAVALLVQLGVLVLIGWAAGTLLVAVGGSPSAGIDVSVTRWLVHHRAEWLTTLMRTATWLGSSTVLAPVVVATGLVARWRTGSWLVLAFLVTTVAGAAALYSIDKALVARPRPLLHPLVHATNYGFPSGHATQATAVYGAIAFLASRRRSTGRLAWPAAGLVVAMVAFSRVYLGVHWTSDVLAGIALGGAWAASEVTTYRAMTASPARDGSNGRPGSDCSS